MKAAKWLVISTAGAVCNFTSQLVGTMAYVQGDWKAGGYLLLSIINIVSLVVNLCVAAASWEKLKKP